MKFRKGEIIEGKIRAIQLSQNQQRIFNFQNNKIYYIYKSHLYKTKSCKFELLEASVYYYCSKSSISQFFPEIEETIVFCIFYPHLEDIQRIFESKRKYTNYRNIQN